MVGTGGRDFHCFCDMFPLLVGDDSFKAISLGYMYIKIVPIDWLVSNYGSAIKGKPVVCDNGAESLVEEVFVIELRLRLGRGRGARRRIGLREWVDRRWLLVKRNGDQGGLVLNRTWGGRGRGRVMENV